MTKTSCDSALVPFDQQDGPMAQETALTTDTAKNQPRTIALNEQGHVVLNDLTQRRGYLSQMLQSSMLPPQYKTIQQVELAWDLLTSMGLPPLPYLPLVVIVNNRLTVMSDALMAACERTGELEWVETVYLDPKNEPMTKANAATFEAFCAVVTAKRKGRPEVWDKFTMKQAEAAGLLRNPTWKAYSSDMLMHRARSRVLRQLFSDSIGGVRVKELDEYVSVMDEAGRPLRTPDGQDIVTKRNVSAGELNEMFGGKQHQPPTPQAE